MNRARLKLDRKVYREDVVQSSNLQEFERREPSRPVNGDRRACPSCGDSMRFKERFVVTRMRVTVAHPAWVCSCGEETYVRPIVPVRRHRAPVERRLVTGIGVPVEGVFAIRHALAYIREQTPRGSSMAMRDLVRLAIAPLQRCPLSILVADDSGRCLGANEAVCALTGYSEDELLGMHIRDLSAPGQRERDQRAWRHFLRGAGFVGEYQLRRKSGEPLALPCVAVAHVIPGLHVATMWRCDRMTVVG